CVPADGLVLGRGERLNERWQAEMSLDAWRWRTPTAWARGASCQPPHRGRRRADLQGGRPSAQFSNSNSFTILRTHVILVRWSEIPMRRARRRSGAQRGGRVWKGGKKFYF